MYISFGKILHTALSFGGDQYVVDSFMVWIIGMAADNWMLDGKIPIGNSILVDSNIMVFI